MPWRPPALKMKRGKADAYQILVSEVMLQQTQVARVIDFYPRFLKTFPTIKLLAEAPLSRVLQLWQGLGYNRRAVMLQRAARVVMQRHAGTMPTDYEALLELPGVGPSTAAGIMNFAYNQPAPYLETNVRTVYLHFFFDDASCKAIDDKEILPLVIKTMDKENPREWFYALLDYGVMLKKTVGNLNRKSKTYTKQSPFEGSARQARAKALRKALARGENDTHLLRLVI